MKYYFRKNGSLGDLIKKFWLASFLIGMIPFLLPFSLSASSFPVLPEFQVYHTIGTRGSTYTSGAVGLSVHLFIEDRGPGRFLHFLGINVPSHTAIWQNRLGEVFMVSPGYGYEFGVHDQWQDPAGKGATLSLRHIDWKKTQRGSILLRNASLDQLHMGWNWGFNRSGFIVWLLGLDITTLHLPIDKVSEIQLALGIRTVF